MAKTLAEMVEAIAEAAARTVPVDMSRWMGEGAEIVLREPSTADLFFAGNDGKLVCKMHPEWPDELANTVALLATCHQSPEPGEGMSAGQLYVALAERNRDAFLAISAAFSREFPIGRAEGEGEG